MLMCSDGTLYTGYTNDFPARLHKHRLGKGAKYTRTRRPLIPVYLQGHDTKSSAMKREYQIKRLTRKEKMSLILKYDEELKKYGTTIYTGQ